MADQITLGGKLMYPSEYVSSVDLGGKDVTVTIASVTRAELRLQGGAVNKKVVVTFMPPATKKLVLCKTNARSIATMYGGEAEKWIGKRVTLYATTCKFGGATVPCIRIRETEGEPSGNPG